MTELEKKQDELIELYKLYFEPTGKDDKDADKIKKLESEIAVLKQGEEVMRRYGVTEKDVQDYLKQGEKADEEKPICKHCGLSEFE